MPVISYIDAVTQALREEMRRDGGCLSSVRMWGCGEGCFAPPAA